MQRLSQHGDRAGPQCAPSRAGSKGSSCPSLLWHCPAGSLSSRIASHSSTCKGTGTTGQTDTGTDTQPPWPRTVTARATSVPTPLPMHTHRCQAVSHTPTATLAPRAGTPGSRDRPAALPSPGDAGGMCQPLPASVPVPSLLWQERARRVQLRLIKRRGPAPSKPPLSVLLNDNLDDAHHREAARGTSGCSGPCAPCSALLRGSGAARPRGHHKEVAPRRGGIRKRWHHEEVASLRVAAG